MEKSELLKMVKEKLSVLETESVELSEKAPNSFTIRIICKDFSYIPIYRRYQILYPMLSSVLNIPGIHLEIDPLTIEEAQAAF